jgi:hypothetical protein
MAHQVQGAAGQILQGAPSDMTPVSLQFFFRRHDGTTARRHQAIAEGCWQPARLACFHAAGTGRGRLSRGLRQVFPQALKTASRNSPSSVMLPNSVSVSMSGLTQLAFGLWTATERGEVAVEGPWGESADRIHGAGNPRAARSAAAAKRGPAAPPRQPRRIQCQKVWWCDFGIVCW